MLNRRYLHINSFDRNIGTPSDFILYLPSSLKCCKAKLIEACMPNSYYNITSSNNQININNSPILINQGSYTLQQLLTQIQSQISLISSISYDDINCRISIIMSASTIISFPSTNSINFVLGFPNNFNQTGTNFLGSFSPSIDQYSIFIEVDELYNNYLTTNNNNSTFAISNNTNKNGIIFFYQHSQFNQQVNFRVPNQPLQQLSIKVKDVYGKNLIGLTEWTMLLEIE
jgi:hypothetical protein